MRRAFVLLALSTGGGASFSIVPPGGPTPLRSRPRTGLLLRPRVHRHDASRTPPPSSSPATATATRMAAASYGKGTEIWPRCNEEPVLLEASFPGGVVPRFARDLLEMEAAPASTNATSAFDDATEESDGSLGGGKRRAVRRTLSHLLTSAARSSRAAAASDNGTFGAPPAAISKSPAIIALALLCAKCVERKHVGAAIGLTAYFVGLASWCAAPKKGAPEGSRIVNMPSLPAGGHVPSLVANPLGTSLTNSRAYRTWLRAGALLGLLLPAAILTQLTLGGRFPNLAALEWFIDVGNVGEARRLVGGPLFLLCCQALTEAAARTALLPLPLRILVPVAYNASRLPSLRDWAFPASAAATTSGIPRSLRALGVANLVYWHVNLLGFLVPVGTVRYLRAHFYCVEAEEVTVREGGGGSVGLLP